MFPTDVIKYTLEKPYFLKFCVVFFFLVIEHTFFREGESCMKQLNFFNVYKGLGFMDFEDVSTFRRLQ